MTLPREVLPDRFYMITRRCTQRQFLLRPDAELDNAFLYCLIEAAIRFDIDLLHSIAMANHHHTTIYDRYGRVCEFVEHFHKMLAKCVNSMRGRWENCWAAEPVCIVRLLDREDVISKIAYGASNPVKDGLVEWASEWPGVNTVTALLEGDVLEAKRPAFFRAEGCMPESVELQVRVPSVLGDPQTFANEVRAKILKVELRHALVRTALGRSVMGRARVLGQSWRGAPTTQEPRRLLRPRLAARSKWARIEALLRNLAFQDEYRRARRALVAGVRVAFPPGTYWLRRFAGVAISTPLEN